MKSVCPLPNCGKVLSCKYRLKTHLERYHQNVRKYECPECFKRFKSRDNLNDHLSKHPKPVEIDPAELQQFREQRAQQPAATAIPKLTDLVNRTSDPDLRPFTVIRRVYPYPIDEETVRIPKIANT